MKKRIAPFTIVTQWNEIGSINTALLLTCASLLYYISIQTNENILTGFDAHTNELLDYGSFDNDGNPNMEYHIRE